MTLYRVYYKSEDGRTYCAYIEVSDTNEDGSVRSSRQRVKAVKETAADEQFIKSDSIIRIVKDC